MSSIQIAGGGQNFAIEYAYGSDVVSIDGVLVSTELLSQMFVAPNRDAWLRFRRNGDVVEVTSTRFSAGELECIPSQLDRIEAGQKLILEEIRKMADSQAQLDTELTTVETDLAALGTELTTAITDLEAKAAGSGIDFTPEVTRLSTIAATLTSLTAAAAAADPGAPAAAAVAEAKPVETPAA